MIVPNAKNSGYWIPNVWSDCRWISKWRYSSSSHVPKLPKITNLPTKLYFHMGFSPTIFNYQDLVAHLKSENWIIISHIDTLEPKSRDLGFDEWLVPPTHS